MIPMMKMKTCPGQIFVKPPLSVLFLIFKIEGDITT